MEEKQGKIRLGKVEVKMGEKTVSLTIDQARELCALLKGLFGDDSTKLVHVVDHWYSKPWYMGNTWSYSGYNWQAQAIPQSNNNVTNGDTVQFTLTSGKHENE